ncbi:MAG: hypothetical protein HY698_20475 [Deltaproteobacteria bacterium]|nr:hypothetical protein [Deltaproteobacteria bacterium]
MGLRSFLASLVLAAVASCGGGSTGGDPDGSVADARTIDCGTDGGVPSELACTGLYRDWETRALADGVYEFKPGFELWSDGANKRRWILLPPGTTIDATDMNEWTFPVGTKLWKEFQVQVGGTLRPVETRMLWKRDEFEWQRTTYVWSDDLKRAVEVTDGVEDFAGTGYEVPSRARCARCHGGRKDGVLGFEAVLLAAPEATGLTYASLVNNGWLTTATNTGLPAAAALQVPGNQGERSALGTLHVNCGISCHNPGHPEHPLQLRLEIGNEGVGKLENTSAFTTAMNMGTDFKPEGADEQRTYYLIIPTKPEQSMVYYRMGKRDFADPESKEQMPPLSTRKVDQAGLKIVGDWIRNMNGPPYPPPVE